MTVKELKEEIAELPDDMIVTLDAWDEKWRQLRMEIANCALSFEEYYDSNSGTWNTAEVLKIY